MDGEKGGSAREGQGEQGKARKMRAKGWEEEKGRGGRRAEAECGRQGVNEERGKIKGERKGGQEGEKREIIILSECTSPYSTFVIHST